EERQAKLDAQVRARSADRRERAELTAISRQGGMLSRGRSRRQGPARAAAGAGPRTTAPARPAEPDALSKSTPSPLPPASRSSFYTCRRSRAGVGSSASTSSSASLSSSSSSSSYRSST
ncbi:hypothetical protein PUR61_41985, partial [Streptomyces sp. BE20]|nr:hypothetical protein [Streptomyces sp. BE20]